MPLALLLTTTAATVVGAAALRSLHGVRKQIAALRAELAEGRTAFTRAVVPAARTTSDSDAIRLAVAAALADERERELAEARAFWAAQEARDATDAPSLLGLPMDDVYLPRPSDFAGLEPVVEPVSEADEFSGESPELAAARRRHPSHPDFVPAQTRGADDHERTVTRLEKLAESGTALADVRPGPLGTLDVYVFADGTTLCMTPGHRDTAERLAAALREGDAPVLLGGSAISGAYALTFACGDENVYVLADRVIASL
ncbi:hypothetical protein ABT009_25855 [Streptomyces sp. NPDC002896]|uniref:hypothetical protein n=1 Tax=Streptomyces sp. NPDC002896 TaxID=3154438 RepID=UPI0033285134